MKKQLYQSPKDKEFSVPFVDGFVTTLGRIGYSTAKSSIRSDDEPENKVAAVAKGVLKQAATRSMPGNHSEHIFLAQDEGSGSLNNCLYNSCLQQIDYNNLDSIISQERNLDFITTVYPTQKTEEDSEEVETKEFSESLNMLLDKDFALFKDVGVSVARGLGNWAKRTTDNKVGGVAGKIASGINKINKDNENTITTVDKMKTVTATGRQKVADKVGANINSKIDDFKNKIIGSGENPGSKTLAGRAKEGLNKAKAARANATGDDDIAAAQEKVDKAQKKVDRINSLSDLANDAKSVVDTVKDNYGGSIVKAVRNSTKAAVGATIAKSAVDSVKTSQSNNRNPYKPVKGSYA